MLIEYTDRERNSDSLYCGKSTVEFARSLLKYQGLQGNYDTAQTENSRTYS